MALEVVAIDRFVILGSSGLADRSCSGSTGPPGGCIHTSWSQKVCCVSQPSIQGRREDRKRQVSTLKEEKRSVRGQSHRSKTFTWSSVWGGTGGSPPEPWQFHLQPLTHVYVSGLSKTASMRSACGKWGQGTVDYCYWSLPVWHTWIPLIPSLHPQRAVQELADAIIQLWQEGKESQRSHTSFQRGNPTVGKPQRVMI